jgi:hypothetical protein
VNEKGRSRRNKTQKQSKVERRGSSVEEGEIYQKIGILLLYVRGWLPVELNEGKGSCIL